MTAVEWLVEQMKKCNMTVSVHNTSHQNVIDFYKAIEQAKEMEKQQCLKMLPYDLDELATEWYKQQKFQGLSDNIISVGYLNMFKEGFQKALELLTFKSK